MAGNKWRELNPWYNLLRYARERCSRKDHDAYPSYGGRGIKALLTVDEMRRLWERDGGEDLERPSLERKDPDGLYSFENCEVIELEENIARAARAKRDRKHRWVKKESSLWKRVKARKAAKATVAEQNRRAALTQPGSSATL